MEYVIYRTMANGLNTKSVQVLIRENQQVRLNEVIVDAEMAQADIDSLISGRLAALFAGGTLPEARVSALALFYATEERRREQVHLKVVFDAFYQLRTGGNVTDMVAAARAAYAGDDKLLALVNTFTDKYKAATEDERNTLDAFALFALSSLIVSR